MKERNLFKELPYFNCNIVASHGQFNNLMSTSCLPSKKYLQKLHSIYDLDVFSLNSIVNCNINPDTQLVYNQIRANYYSPHSFNNTKKSNRFPFPNENSFSILHNNVRSLRANFDNFQDHLICELDDKFDILGISETKITINSERSIDFNLNIDNYSFEYVPTPLASGGVEMYINNNLKYSVIEKTSNESFQALWIEIHNQRKKNTICGIIYRQHNSPDVFLSYLEESLEKYSARQKPVFILGDFNIDLLKAETLVMSFYFLYKAIIFFQLLTNLQECIITLQHSLITYSRIIVNTQF